MTAPYSLAIDVGTSRTAAAIARPGPDGNIVASALTLGRSSDNAPTAVFVSDGELLFGDAAERRGAGRPEHLVREFKRRVGDEVPIVVADRRFTAEDLFARTVGWVIGTAIEREGQHPAHIAVTVPVMWGAFRTRLVEEAIARQGWTDVTFLTEPEAAARHYEATNPVPAGRALAVYDFGGGTFDAVVLRKRDDGGVDFAGAPVGIADLGGADFDDLVVRHIVRTAELPAQALVDSGGQAGTRLALAALRRECMEAKEALSFDAEAVVPVLIGEGHGTVRLTRAEFEDMIEPEIERTIEVLERAIEGAGVSTDELDAILLTGGSSRIPRVAQLLSERFDRPVAVDADPKAIIALGAARAIATAAVPVTAADEAIVDEEDFFDKAFAAAAPAQPKPKRNWLRPTRTGAVITGAAAVVLAGGLVAANATGLSLGFGPTPVETSQAEAAPFDSRLFTADLQAPPSLDLPAEPVVETTPVETAEQEESQPSTPVSNQRKAPTKATKRAAERTTEKAPKSTTPANNSNQGSNPAPSNPQPGNPSDSNTQDTPDPAPVQPNDPAPVPTNVPEPVPTTPAPAPSPDPVQTPDPVPVPTPEPEPLPTTTPDTVSPAPLGTTAPEQA